MVSQNFEFAIALAAIAVGIVFLWIARADPQ